MRFFLFSFCVFISSAVLANSQACRDHHCLAVVDAGSTGSRVHLYAYDLDNSKTPTAIQEVWSKKIKPGLATLETKPEILNNYLNELLNSAPEREIPLYFYATAGMRLLPQPKQQAIYQQIQQWFANQQEWQLREVRTITGDEEGLFGWLAVNYQLGTLNPQSKESPVSVMDMGGASVQVIIPLQSVNAMLPQSTRPVDIYGRHYLVYVQSFLGLGQTLLSEQYLNSQSCFADGYRLPSGEVGKGDASQCERDVAKLINKVHHVNKIVMPIINQNNPTNWYVIGGLGALAQDKLFHFENNELTGESLMAQADSSICHQPWQGLYETNPTHEYLYGYCLFPAYYYALMVDGYGLSPTQPIHFMPADKQGGDWSLGVVLQSQTLN